MSKVHKEKTKKKRIRISAEYMEGTLHFNYNPPRNPAVSTAGGIGSVSRMVFFVLVLDILLDYILAHIAERAHKVTV